MELPPPKRMKTNSTQWAVLVEFVEIHPEMVTHKHTGVHGRQNYNKLWAEIAGQLNSMGFGFKTPEKWQEV